MAVLLLICKDSNLSKTIDVILLLIVLNPFVSLNSIENA